MDRLFAMRVYVAVAEAGSFVRAAEQLRISTTSASRLVSDLERHLGGRLLQRTTRRVASTEAGMDYYERCRQILADVDEAESLAAEADASPKGLLRVSLPQSFGMRYVAPGIPDFCALHPLIELDVSFSDKVVEFVEEGVDVAIRISVELKETLVARRLMTISLVACASPSYLAKRGKPEVAHDLRRHNCLQYSYASVGKFVGEVPVEGNFRTNSGEMLRLAALAGQGIAVLPAFLVADDLHSGKLERVLEKQVLPELGVHAVYLESARRSARIRAFVDYFSEALDGNLPGS